MKMKKCSFYFAFHLHFIIFAKQIIKFRYMRRHNKTWAMLALAALLTMPMLSWAQNNRQQQTPQRKFGNSTEGQKQGDRRPTGQDRRPSGQDRNTPPPAPRGVGAEKFLRGDQLIYNNPRPGGLKEAITPEVRKRVRRLTIEGPLNKDDASVIRSICNRSSCVDDRGKSIDNYVDLDLSRATIEKTYSSDRDVTYEEMFYNTDRLRSVRLPIRLKALGRRTFSGCSRLESVMIPRDVRFIGEGAFRNCSNLQEIRLPEGLEEIGDEAFLECKKLTQIRLPNSLRHIGNKAFYNCPLTELRLPDGLQTLGKWSLSGTRLRDIYIPRDTRIEGDSPGSSIYMERIDVDRGNRYYTSLEGVLFDRSQATLLQMPAAARGVYNIPQSVQMIAPDAFFGCALTKINIPNSVTTIGESAFSNCPNILSIEIPQSVNTIGNYTFSNCENLTSVTLPENLVSIGNYAFAHCQRLMEIAMPFNLNRLGEGAFQECRGLRAIRLPEGITAIPEKCFNNCKAMTAIQLPSRLQSIEEEAFRGCDALPEIILPNTLRNIGNEAFRACLNLVEVTLPASVQTIGKKPFSKCSGLRRIICESPTPPDFKSNDNEKVTLVVPPGCQSLYKKASQWKKYKSIVEY